MQYFLGLHEFQQEPLFDPSMMVHFRKRFPVEEVARINEYVCTGKWPEDGRDADRNDGVPEALPEADTEDDDNQDENKPSGGKPAKGRKNPNTAKKKGRKKKKNRGQILDAILYEGALWVILIGAARVLTKVSITAGPPCSAEMLRYFSNAERTAWTFRLLNAVSSMSAASSRWS